MSVQFKAVVLTHRLAPLAVRERVALDETGCRRLLAVLREELALTDLLVLSTCNRTEVYYSADDDQTDAIVTRLLREKKLTEHAADYRRYFTALLDHAAAVQHLFEVALGLDAQVVGDLQITGQVKQAYQWAADADTAGPLLHRLLHTIFYANKRVVTETAFRDGAASTSYATVALVEELTADLPAPKVLVVGLGEIGADVVRNLLAAGFGHVTLTNRTLTRATQLAEECPEVRIRPFEELSAALQEADVVVSSIAAEQPFFTAELMRRLNVLSFKFFVDLAVPRSIESAAENVPGILVYNLDAIQQRATKALEQRLAAIPQVQGIIAESIAGFSDWSREMLVSPIIHRMKNALEQLRQEELDRYQKKVSAEEAQRLDQVTRSLMQKVLKRHVLQLKAVCRRDEAEQLIELLGELFDPEKQPAGV